MLKNRFKDEKSFALTIKAKYIMGNTRNKEFVNVPYFLIDDINNYFDLQLLTNEMQLLNFKIIYFEDAQNYCAFIKESEERELRFYKLFFIENFK